MKKRYVKVEQQPPYRRKNKVILRWPAVTGLMNGRGGSTPPDRFVISIFCSWSSSQLSGVSLSREYVVKYDTVLIESRLGFDFQKTMHSNYKPFKPVVFSPMFQSLTMCGNSFLCCRRTIWSSYVIKNLVEGWDCDCETVIDSCSFVSVVYMDSLAFSPALDNSLNNLCIFALNPT